MKGSKYGKIYEILAKDYDHEIPEIPRTREFSQAFRQIIARKLRKEGLVVVKQITGACECSGFITDREGHYVYYRTSDYRYFPNEWRYNILIRPAENTSDFKGGYNHYTSLDRFAKEVKRLMK